MNAKTLYSSLKVPYCLIKALMKYYLKYYFAKENIIGIWRFLPYPALGCNHISNKLDWNIRELSCIGMSVACVWFFASQVDCSISLCPSPSPEFAWFMSIESVIPFNHLILCHLSGFQSAPASGLTHESALAISTAIERHLRIHPQMKY